MKSLIIEFRFLLAILLLIVNDAIAKRKSEVIINYTSKVEVCPDADSKAFMETDNLMPLRINETTSKLEGKFSFKKELDKLFKLQIIIERVLPSGSSEVIGTHTVKDMCLEFSRRDKETLYGTYMKTINVPNCPIPPAEYMITNMIADTRQVPRELLIMGVYKFTFTFYQYEVSGSGIFATTKDTRLGCISFECTVEAA